MSKNNKLVAIAKVIILVGLSMLFIGCGKEESYRMMQVYQVSGNVTIERENVGTMEAFENLNLMTGDKVQVAQNSYMRLKVDDDKFVLAEEGSVFKINTSGSEGSGRTNIELEKGAVTVEVQNKLTEDEAFEVTTPNSIMAVRGTVFRISADVDKEGKTITKIVILEGEISVQQKDENGNLSEEQKVESGNEAIIYKDIEELKIIILNEISYDDIPVEVLEFLQEIVEERRELVISSDEIKSLIENQKAANDGESSSDGEPSSDETTENQPSGDSQREKNENDEPQSEASQGEETGNDEPQSVESQDNVIPNVVIPSISTEGNDTQEDTVTYTVTFKYNGNVFATQSVESGKLATKPTLMPAKSGSWNFDFSTPIYEDIIIEFIE